MAKPLIIFLFFIGFAHSTQADTIDYWHVYYNKIKVIESALSPQKKPLLRIRDLEKTDSLTIIYYKDAFCRDCKTQVTIEDGRQTIVAKSNGIGTAKPIVLALSELLQHHLSSKEKMYTVFYHEEQRELHPIPIFHLIIEF